MTQNRPLYQQDASDFRPDQIEPDIEKTGLITRRRLLIGGALALGGLGLGSYLVLREKGPDGDQLMEGYDKAAGLVDRNNPNKLDNPKKHQYILEQVANGNMPGTYNDFVWIEAKGKGLKGKKPTIVRFKAAPHPLRLGTRKGWREFPIDGPYGMACAEVLGFTLPTPWMVRAIAHQAMNFKTSNPPKFDKYGCPIDFALPGKGKVPFFAYQQIAMELQKQGLKVPSDNTSGNGGEWQKSPQFVRQRNVMLHAWLQKNRISPDTLIAGSFKEICLPSKKLVSGRDDSVYKSRLEFAGGYDDTGALIQSYCSGGPHPAYYSDYSHGLRFIESDELEVLEDGWDKPRILTFSEFHNNTNYGLEFSFDAAPMEKRAYPYPKDLALWMEDNGHIRESYDNEEDKKNREKWRKAKEEAEKKDAGSK